MTVTMADPTARLLDLPAQSLGPSAPPKPSASERTSETGGIRRRRTTSFTVHTDRGRGSYRTYAKADAAARWVAATTGEVVSVVNERTGERWQRPISRLGGSGNEPGEPSARAQAESAHPMMEPPKTGRTRDDLATLPSPVPQGSRRQ